MQIKFYDKNNFASINTSKAAFIHENNMFHTHISYADSACVFSLPFLVGRTYTFNLEIYPGYQPPCPYSCSNKSSEVVNKLVLLSPKIIRM